MNKSTKKRGLKRALRQKLNARRPIVFNGYSDDTKKRGWHYRSDAKGRAKYLGYTFGLALWRIDEIAQAQ